MANYNIYLETEREKYALLDLARKIQAKITGVSGCGPGYYIQLDADQEQADWINRNLYTEAMHRMTAPEAWAAWKAGRMTVQQLFTWQQQHGVCFNERGEVVPLP